MAVLPTHGALLMGLHITTSHPDHKGSHLYGAVDIEVKNKVKRGQGVWPKTGLSGSVPVASGKCHILWENYVVYSRLWTGPSPYFYHTLVMH